MNIVDWMSQEALNKTTFNIHTKLHYRIIINWFNHLQKLEICGKRLFIWLVLLCEKIFILFWRAIGLDCEFAEAECAWRYSYSRDRSVHRWRLFLCRRKVTELQMSLLMHLWLQGHNFYLSLSMLLIWLW